MINRMCEKEPQQRSGSASQKIKIIAETVRTFHRMISAIILIVKSEKSNIISIMRSEDAKRSECPSLLIHLPHDRLFWIPVTDALAFDDYTILHLTDHLDCAVDLFSLQHLATSWLSEFLTELRNDRCIFILHSDYTVCLMVACGDIPAQDFHQRFCSRISFRILTLDSGSLRCA